MPMDASTSDETRSEALALIRDSARQLLRQAGGIGRARALRFTDPGFSREILSRMGAAGWIGALTPEESGGAGLGTAEFCAICQELGAVLAPEPFVAATLSAALLARAGAGSRRLASVLRGERFALTLWQEAIDGLDAPAQACSERLFAPFAFAADYLLVPVPSEAGFTLIEVDPRDVEFIAQRTQDGGQLCTVRPVNAFVGHAIGTLPVEALAAALEDATLAIAAVLLGVAEGAFALTLEHLRTRRQFDQPIGSFQALRHRAADLKMQLELMRASIEAAAVSIDSGAGRDEVVRAVSRAKVRAGEATLGIVQEAIQMHGAIGYTDEHDIGLYLRKAMVLVNQFGSPAWHRSRYGRLELKRAA